MSETIWNDVKEDIIPSLFSGAIALGAYNLVFGESITSTIPFIGGEAPAWLVVGGTVSASHLAGNVLQHQILPMIESKDLASAEGVIGKPLLSGLALYGMFRLGVSEDVDFIKSVGLGAGSVISGQYASSAFGYQ
jgi:hypothetical protein